VIDRDTKSDPAHGVGDLHCSAPISPVLRLRGGSPPGSGDRFHEPWAQQGAPETRPHMTLTRPFIFWTALFAVVILIVLLLREIVLPFVAGVSAPR
jgi:hypothetical protein